MIWISAGKLSPFAGDLSPHPPSAGLSRDRGKKKLERDRGSEATSRPSVRGKHPFSWLYIGWMAGSKGQGCAGDVGLLGVLESPLATTAAGPGAGQELTGTTEGGQREARVSAHHFVDSCGLTASCLKMAPREPPRGQPGQGGRDDGLGVGGAELYSPWEMAALGSPKGKVISVLSSAKGAVPRSPPCVRGWGAHWKAHPIRLQATPPLRQNPEPRWAFWAVLADAMGVSAQLWGLRLGGDTGRGSEEEPES